MSNFQDNPSVGGSVNKFDGENETPFKWAYEMDKTQFKYRCPCKKGYHAHGNGGDPHTNRVEYRSSHCREYGGDIRIAITEETPRALDLYGSHAVTSRKIHHGPCQRFQGFGNQSVA